MAWHLSFFVLNVQVGVVGQEESNDDLVLMNRKTARLTRSLAVKGTHYLEYTLAVVPDATFRAARECEREKSNRSGGKPKRLIFARHESTSRNTTDRLYLSP